MTKKIAQSVRIKPLEIHRSGNEKFLVQLGYGRIFGPEFAARTRIFARELKSLETDFRDPYSRIFKSSDRPPRMVLHVQIEIGFLTR